MDSDRYAFWGITLKPGEPADLKLEDGETLHVTMASYGVDLADPKGRSVVTASVEGENTDLSSMRGHGLAVLNAGVAESRVMDVSFIGEESISFEVTGKNIVHLVGNFSFDTEGDDNSDDSEDEEDGLIALYDDDNRMEDDDDEDDDDDSSGDASEPLLLMTSDPPVITEVTESDENEEKKNVKLPNGNHKAIVVEVNEGKDVVKSQKKEAAKPQKKETGRKNKKKEEKTVSFKQNSKKEEGKNNDGSTAKINKSNQKGKKPGKAAIVQKTEADDGEETEDEENEEVDIKADEDEIKPAQPTSDVTPKGKRNRSRKRKNGNAAHEELTPPTSKKSKVSERPGTPAVTKGVLKNAKANALQKTTKVENNDGAASAGGNGVKKDLSETATQDKTKENGDNTKSNKKRRRKGKKAVNSA